jgi:hypothetical protein
MLKNRSKSSIRLPHSRCLADDDVEKTRALAIDLPTMLVRNLARVTDDGTYRRTQVRDRITELGQLVVEVL